MIAPTPRRRPAGRSQTALLAFFLMCAGAALALAWSTRQEMFLFLAVGLAAIAICLLPIILTDNYDILSPWSTVLAVVVLGLGVRSVYIAFGFEGERTLDDLFLLGRNADYFTYPSLVLLLSLGLMAAATVLWRRRIPWHRTLAGRAANYTFGHRLPMVVLVCQIVAFIAFIVYAQRTGGLSPERLSAKRTTISGVDIAADTDYRSDNYLRVINSLAPVSYLMYLAHCYARGARRLMRTWRAPLLVLMILNSVLLPVYASSRTDALYVVLMAAVVRYYCDRSRSSRSARSVLTAVVFVAMAFALMTTARNQIDFGPADAAAAVSVDQVIDAIVYNRNMVDIPKTAQVINRVPEVLPYENGSTYAAWVVAPIPRNVWPTKPLVQSGPILGTTIYGTARAGVPPGLIAEAYWNFGLPGVVVGSLLFGASLSYLYRKIRPSGAANPVAVLVYAVGVVRLGPYVLGNSLGSGLFNMTVDTILLVGLLAISGSRKPPAKQSSRTVQRRVAMAGLPMSSPEFDRAG